MADQNREPVIRPRPSPLITTILGSSSSFPSCAGGGRARQRHRHTQTGGSFMQPYNPQQWAEASHSAAAPTTTVTTDPVNSTSRACSVELPTPPPPYSPPGIEPSFIGRCTTRPLMRECASTASNVTESPPMGRTMLPSPRLRVSPVDNISRMSRVSSQLSIQIPTNAYLMAPGSRRAASTPASATLMYTRPATPPRTQWDPRMPVPPPPPGPPPLQPRSQSTSRMYDSLGFVSPPPRRLPPTTGSSSLCMIPGTPAHCDSMEQAQAEAPRAREAMQSPRSTQTASIVQSPPSGGVGLNRSPALRIDKSLKQRRAESRSGPVPQKISSERRLTDIVVPRTATGVSAAVMPIAARSALVASPPSDNQHGHKAPTTMTRPAPHSAPIPTAHCGVTPPFSPPQTRQRASFTPTPSTYASVLPKSLPTPPPQPQQQLHMADVSTAAYTDKSATVLDVMAAKHIAAHQSPQQFCQASIERFQNFASREMATSSDAERIKLFGEFIVAESRIRRERYSAAMGVMGSHIFDLTRDLFRPLDASPRLSVATSFGPLEASSSSIATDTMSGETPVAPTFTVAHAPAVPKRVDAASTASSSGGMPSDMNTSQAVALMPSPAGYKPSLSPILSMSMEDDSSRGRPPSRWWESSSNDHHTFNLSRSKRESKYMGVPKEAWLAPEGTRADVIPAGSEYPSDKARLVSGSSRALDPGSTSQTRAFPRTSPVPTKAVPRDFSRLITLPPPYPRHYPAVNNNHPQLAVIRSHVRTLSDLSEVEAANERFRQVSEEHREKASRSATERKKTLRANLQVEVSTGRMSYAEAASIENDSMNAEKDALTELEMSDFEMYQRDVVTPVYQLLTARIVKATELFEELRGRLFPESSTEAVVAAAEVDRAQEEGDETPELVEKLTLLKWIFEAREALHRAVHKLLTARNERYRHAVVTPYRLNGNTAKLASADEFFAKDARARSLQFAQDLVRRTAEFKAVIELNVRRGVEMQLSTFWDIAPPLRRLLDTIPPDLGTATDFTVDIPPKEFDENPSYHRHPLQYLYSLLQHAEESTYQFIESQTNLLCLLHEVCGAMTIAKARLRESQKSSDDGSTENVSENDRNNNRKQGGHDLNGGQATEESLMEEHKRNDEDLKGKVQVVQGQWDDALGAHFKAAKARVGEYLLSTDGWDEMLEDNGMGGL